MFRRVFPFLALALLAPAGVLGVALRDAHFADFMQPLARGGELRGAYTLHDNVSKVEFADGTAVGIPDAP